MTDPILRPSQDAKTGKAAKGNRLAVKHGGHSFLATGRLPSIRGRKRIQRTLNDFRAALVAAVPDSEDPRISALIGQVVRAEGFLFIIEAHLRRFGILKLGKDGLESMPVLKDVVSFMNVQRAAILAMGMEKRELEAIKAPYELLEKDGSK
jgi:hypothetical protein